MEFNMKKIKVGMMVEGKVFMVTDDSVHIDLGSHAEGVIYKKGLALEEIKSCKDLVKEGDTILAKVTKMDDENQQILLSRLDVLKEERKEKLNEEIKNSEKITAKVTRVNKGGLELNYQGVRLFMPASHVALERVELEEYKGQTLDCVVIEDDGKKIVVSRRKLLQEERRQNRKADFEKVELDSEVTGKVTRIEDFGAFVELGNVQGLIHRSQVSHYRTDRLREVLKVGDQVTAKVISKDKGKIALSLKALQETPWEKWAKVAEIGQEVTGKVVKKMATGMLIEVERDVVGIINKKDYSWDPRINLAGTVEVGDELTVKILTLDPQNRKMSLSKKHLEYNPWKDVTVKEGEEVSGTVEELQPRGALVKVQGVKAFLPIGEIQSERVQDIAQVLKVDDVIKAVVTKVDRDFWKMTISIRQLVEGKQRAEFEQYLENEEEASNTTLGDLFKDQLEKFKK